MECCDVCRLGLAIGDKPYVVPMNFGYEFDLEKLSLYFHCANDGYKLDIISKNPNACFEVDCSHVLEESEQACGYSMKYRSVIGQGIISHVTEAEEKIRALKILMKHYAPEREFEFTPKEAATVTVLKLDVLEFTAKARL